jgi:hypothetical protein
VRTLGEIEADLNNLYLNAQSFQWSPTRSVASGCVFEEIRPDMKTGQFNLISSQCQSVYSLQLSSTQTLEPVEALTGTRKSSRRASTHQISVLRIPENTAVPEISASAVDEESALRIREMEEDLMKRQSFYEAVKGTYEGKLEGTPKDFRIRITLVPSLPPYLPGRVRTEEEIRSDLEKLHFNIQVVQWDSQDELSAVGCLVQGVKPDLINGEIQIASESCPNLYLIKIANPERDKIRRSPKLSKEKFSKIKPPKPENRL